MADVTGRISTLPGSYHKVPEGTLCDGWPIEHATPVLAKYRIQGETDSMGSEMNDYCEACRNEMLRLQDIAGPDLHICDWCKKGPTETKPMRDFEEGSSGPVYDVCAACRAKQANAIADELAENDTGDDYGWEEPKDHLDNLDDESPVVETDTIHDRREMIIELSAIQQKSAAKARVQLQKGFIRSVSVKLAKLYYFAPKYGTSMRKKRYSINERNRATYRFEKRFTKKYL